jgi:hypothetical protein
MTHGLEPNRMRTASEPRLRISDAVRSTATKDGRILLDIRQGRILGLNVIGSRIFELLQLGLDQAQIADEISRDFGVNIQMVQADVLDFLRSLQEQHILHFARSDGAF